MNTPSTIEFIKIAGAWTNTERGLAFPSKRLARNWAGAEGQRTRTRITLRFRFRAAGAGAPTKPKDQKRVNLVVRVRPDVKAGFQARAKRNDTSAGEEVDRAHDATENM